MKTFGDISPQPGKLAEWRSAKNATRPRKNVLVCFLGIDGSGKTSNAIRLSRQLSRTGISSVYVRPDDLLTKSVPKALVQWVSNHFFASSKKNIDRPTTHGNTNSSTRFSNRMVKTLALGAFLVYSWTAYLLTVKTRLQKKVIVSDRYFYDWAYFLGRGYSDILVRLIPQPDVVFVLDLTVREAFSRMHSENDKEFSPTYYNSLRIWYLALATNNGFFVVNSGSELKKTENDILSTMTIFLREESI